MAPGGLCSINGRPGRAAALGGGARRALAEPARAQAHGPRGRPAGAAQRGLGLGLLHGDIFSLLRSNRGRPREAGPGLRGSGRGGEKSWSRSPAGPGAPAARGVGTTPAPTGCSAPHRPRLGRRCPVMATSRPQHWPDPDAAGRDGPAGHDGTCRSGRRAALTGPRIPGLEPLLAPDPAPRGSSPPPAPPESIEKSVGIKSLPPIRSKEPYKFKKKSISSGLLEVIFYNFSLKAKGEKNHPKGNPDPKGISFNL